MTTTEAPPAGLTVTDVRRAAAVVAGEVRATPARRHPALDRALDRTLGTRVVVKHEETLPTGSFKVRGGIHLASTLPAGGPALVTCSTGNHAQSVAYAARLAGTRAVVVMPACAPAVKRAAVEALGAEVVAVPGSLADAAAHARALAAGRGLRFVDPTDPQVVLGHATLYLELLEAHPDLDVLHVPVGSGTGAAGACVVRDAVAPACRVVGVQSSAAPAAWLSWTTGELVTAPSTTRVSGLATTSGYALPQQLMARGLSDFVLVDDADVTAAARLLHRTTGTVAEGAGAASLAGLLADPRRPARCGVVVTGGNADADELAALAA